MYVKSCWYIHRYIYIYTYAEVLLYIYLYVCMYIYSYIGKIHPLLSVESFLFLHFSLEHWWNQHSTSVTISPKMVCQNLIIGCGPPFKGKNRKLQKIAEDSYQLSPGFWFTAKWYFYIPSPEESTPIWTTSSLERAKHHYHFVVSSVAVNPPALHPLDIGRSFGSRETGGNRFKTMWRKRPWSAWENDLLKWRSACPVIFPINQLVGFFEIYNPLRKIQEIPWTRQLKGLWVYEFGFLSGIGGTWGILQRYLQIIWEYLNMMISMICQCLLFIPTLWCHRTWPGKSSQLGSPPLCGRSRATAGIWHC